LIRSVRGPISPRISCALPLETRGLHALPGKKLIDGFAVHAEHPSDAHGVEPPVMNQAPNRLRMNAELIGDITNADETVGIGFRS
jgi:hypothetical protein